MWKINEDNEYYINILVQETILIMTTIDLI